MFRRLAPVALAAFTLGLGSITNAGPILLVGFDASVLSQGFDIQYPSGTTNTVFQYSSEILNTHNFNLTLDHQGSDQFVNISSLASASGIDSLSPNGRHATADFSIYGATTATGSVDQRANPWSQMENIFTFAISQPTWVRLTFDGVAAHPIPDPYGFDQYTDGGGSGPSFSHVFYSPSTVHDSASYLLSPTSPGTFTEYQYILGGQSYDVQNPFGPGTYSESFSARFQLDLQTVPEPSTLVSAGLGMVSLASVAVARRIKRKAA
jgi:hypothetical protein